MGEHILSLTEEELIRILKLPGTPGEEGFTTDELYRALGRRWHKNSIGRKVSDLVQQGIVEFVGCRNLPDVTGRPHPRPVYRLVKTNGRSG